MNKLFTVAILATTLMAVNIGCTKVTKVKLQTDKQTYNYYYEEVIKVYEDHERNRLIKLIHSIRPNPPVSHETASQIVDSVMMYSKIHNLPPVFVITIIYVESCFYTKAKGSSGDTGLMQVIPRYHKTRMKKLGVKPKDLSNIKDNIRVGCDILGDVYCETGSLHKAAMRYNGKKSYADKVMRKYKQFDKKYNNLHK